MKTSKKTSKKKRRKKARLTKIKWIAVSILIPVLALIFVKVFVLDEKPHEKVEMSPGKQDNMAEAEPLEIEKPLPQIDTSQAKSHAGILLRAEDGEILAQFQADQKIFPASLTKIMTCIVAIENLASTEETVTLDAGIFDALYSQNASMAGFQPGEELKAIDLLYGVILPSGGECCVGIADYIAGSEQAFVALMNQKAAELGMSSTNFANATGLYQESHYSTVRDLGIALRYALGNDTFREIFHCRSHSVPPTNRHPEGITFRSSMFKEQEQWEVNGGEITGGKTGFTDEAGLCLASDAVVDDIVYIAVTAGAEGNHNTEPYHVQDAFYLYNQIHTN